MKTNFQKLIDRAYQAASNEQESSEKKEAMADALRRARKEEKCIVLKYNQSK